ncbi:MAG: serine/threonine protein kinase [Aridibacter sp.]
MSSKELIGQILDGKYKIDKQLGKGGMGTVYLSTHIGTARPVAVKVIAPDFMKRAEFVERFRREAKAAGRLRHPNVVDVTDFGFARTESEEDVAYLVMEYLDGCTLGEVLNEEKKLPLSFTIDILAQVSSAIEEAHKQGIIHRDLKPDNIWLEPNQRGGFTVKVLDFGIAKLEESQIPEAEYEIENPGISNLQTAMIYDNQTTAGERKIETLTDKKSSSTIISENETVALVEESKNFVADQSEAGTLIQPFESESRKIDNSEDNTAILPANQTQALENEDSKGTRIISEQEVSEKYLQEPASTNDLTKVGAVLGTPLYMSPEQCRGEKLTHRSDIYSLAIIVYQMLSGNLPFTGDYLDVMKGHKTEEPPPLIAKKVPKKLKAIIMQSLSKSPKDRPETAEAFANKVRANSEGIGSLLRRSLTIYNENLPKILLLTFLTFLPLIILTVVKVAFGVATGFELVGSENLKFVNLGFEIFNFFLSVVLSALLVGMMTWLVAQYLAYPLRPLSLRSAFREAKRKAKSLSLTVGLSTIISTVGFIFCLIPGVWLAAKFMLIAPSIMMEGVNGKTAFKRSMEFEMVLYFEN